MIFGPALSRGAQQTKWRVAPCRWRKAPLRAERGRRNPEEGRQAFSRMKAGHLSEPRIIAAAGLSGARRAPKKLFLIPINDNLDLSQDILHA